MINVVLWLVTCVAVRSKGKNTRVHDHTYYPPKVQVADTEYMI